MKMKYGAFEFATGEAGLTDVVIRPKYSIRGFKETEIIEMHVEGDVCINGQYDITARLNDIGNALAIPDQDFGLFHDNDTPSIHFLESSASNILNLTGNQIFYKRFPIGENGEYATGRRFTFGVRAEVNAYESSLIDYRDSIHRTGNGGPIAHWENTRFGPRVEQLAPSSLVVLRHSGRAVNSAGYMLPPMPYFAFPFYQNNLEDVKLYGPDRYPRAFVNFTTEWNYTYILPFDPGLTPTLR